MSVLGWVVAQLRGTLRGWGAVALAAAVASMLLAQALAVGVGLRDALDARAAARRGPVVTAWTRREGFYSESAVPRLQDGTAQLAAALSVAGAAAGPSPQNVTLWGLGPTPWTSASPAPGEGWVSASLAASLGVADGDRLVVRVARPGVLPRDAALAQEEGRVVPVGLDVRVVDDAWPANAALDADPLAPPVVRVDRAWLGARLGREDAANVLLADGPLPSPDFALGDLSLALVPSPEGAVLVSDGVLLPDTVVDALRGWQGAEPITTWFFESVRGEHASVPYGFVTTEPALGPDDVVVVQELATRLGVAGGDVVTLRYPVVGRGRAVRWDERPFRVVQVVDDATWSAARTPPIEGLTGRARCGDWNPGLDVDLSRIGDADEAWWAAHGAAPRMALGDTVAPAMFESPWGRWTGVRFPEGVDEAALLARLRDTLGWGGLGWVRRDVAAAARATAAPSTDFAGLFLAFQSILFGAAVALSASTAALVAATRAEGLATLRALGFSTARVRALFLAEVAVVAGVGALFGVVAASLTAPLLGVWLRSALGEVLAALVLVPRLDATSAGVAVAVGAIVTVLAAAWGSAPALRVAPLEALRTVDGLAVPRVRWAGVGALIASLGAVALMVVVPAERTPSAVAVFFAGGALVMLAAALGVRAAVQRRWTGVFGLLTANAARAPMRPLAVLLTLGGSVWLVAGVGLGAGQAVPDLADPAGPTGGFQDVVSWVLPPLRPVEGGVPVWARFADDASCLQLGTATTPHVFGVTPDAMVGRFGVVDGVGFDGLGAALDDGAIPVVGDVGTLTWGMKVGVGDRVTVADGSGQPMTLAVVGVLGKTMLQGGVWMDAEIFRQRFPAEEGPRFALVEGDGSAWAESDRDLGASVASAASRLARYDAVEHAYIAVFRVLGGLGLVLGALAVPLLWMRNLVERQSELRLLRALGFSGRRVLDLLWVEHVALFLIALVAGAVAAVVSAWPAVGASAPWGAVGGAWAAAAALGLAVFAALRHRVAASSGV